METVENIEVINLLGLNQKSLEDFFVSIEEKPFRAVQVMKWMHQRGISDFSQMTDLSKGLREKLESHCVIRAPEVIYEKTSQDGTRKWVISVGDKDLIEMVLIPEKNRATLCVSSQVGCAVDCSFCATGKQGFSRNLNLDEIIGQVWVAANSFGVPRSPDSRPITNVVMMGMGEPLLNFGPVVDAMNLMMDDNAYGLSKRKVTLSTSGIVPKIDGWMWMLHGDTGVDNFRAYSEGDREGSDPIHFIESGPHLMLLPKDPSSMEGQTTEFTSGAPYVMFKGTPYVHLMIPVDGYYDYQPNSSPN